MPSGDKGARGAGRAGRADSADITRGLGNAGNAGSAGNASGTGRAGNAGAAGSSRAARPWSTSSGRPRAGRAQQFMPFAALRGYYALVRNEERIVEPRREHTEEDIARLSELLARVKKGDVLRVTHYEGEAYVTTCGAVTEVVPEYQLLRLIKRTIEFENIYEIEFI